MMYILNIEENNFINFKFNHKQYKNRKKRIKIIIKIRFKKF